MDIDRTLVEAEYYNIVHALANKQPEDSQPLVESAMRKLKKFVNIRKVHWILVQVIFDLPAVLALANKDTAAKPEQNMASDVAT